MANNKTGFIYYSTDTNRYQDIKIKKLKRSFGGFGVAIYDYILCEIYRVKGCFIEWDESTAFDVADYWDIKESLVGEIVNYCCNVGLFNKELLASEGILSSKPIVSRYVDWSKKAKRSFKLPENLAKLLEESPKLPEQSAKPMEVCPQSKVKESKEDNTPTFEFSNNGFYDLQLKTFNQENEIDRYRQLVLFLHTKMPSGKYQFQNILSMQSQIGFKEYLELKKVEQNSERDIREIFEAMENKPKLAKEYKDVYLTARNWLKRSFEKKAS